MCIPILKSCASTIEKYAQYVENPCRPDQMDLDGRGSLFAVLCRSVICIGNISTFSLYISNPYSRRLALSKVSRDKPSPRLPAARTDAMCAEKCGRSSERGHRRNAPMGRMPTLLGGASIASGYTPPALAGAMPRHPLPLKGRKSAVQKEARHAKSAPQ